MTDSILVLNAGSSSIKFALYALNQLESAPLIKGKIVNIGQSPQFITTDDKPLTPPANPFTNFDANTSHKVLIEWLLEWLKIQTGGLRLKAVGHRVVHGGLTYSKPVKINKAVLADLKKLISLAPLHQPHNLLAIEAVCLWAPDLTQIACFDTSFHHTQHPLAKLFALPRVLSDQGIVRYGFHGLSYQYIANCLPHYMDDLSEGRIVVAHLGNGASMCAMKNRKSYATSMGLTALDGLMMGQRCGNLDAGVVLHLIQECEMTVDEVQHLLYFESGLLGVSGISNDMHVLQNSASQYAKLAIDLFCYRAARELAALANDLLGLDAIIFTAGIGENSSLVRRDICERLAWLGVKLDDNANEANLSTISTPESEIKVLVIPTDEESIIAQATNQALIKQNNC